jgi:hypothetical protein
LQKARAKGIKIRTKQKQGKIRIKNGRAVHKKNKAQSPCYFFASALGYLFILIFYKNKNKKALLC